MGADYTSYYEKMIQKLKKKAEESIQRIMPAVWADYFRFAEQRIKVMFKDVVKDFYADYTPILYDRNYGLFDLLETEATPEQLSIHTNPLNMTGYRNGYHGDSGLYDLVFRHGWHGGADHGDYTRSYSPDSAEGFTVISTPHPNPGTPYWREPVPFYTRWGVQAVSSEPPIEAFRAKLNEYNNGINNEDYMRAWNIHSNKIQITW